MPLRCYVIHGHLDKSDHIGLEMCYVFHCAVVSLSDIFEAAVSVALYWSIAPKLSHQCFIVLEIETAVPKLSNNDTAGQ